MSSTEPLVSVVMIFRNAERFIDEAIRSVIGQTLGSWELVLVDDGSTDGGPPIAAAYQERHRDRIRLLRHPGGGSRGTGPSRNLGMQDARGRYLAFLDADDVYEPARLERHVRCLEEDPELGVVLSPDLYWYSWQPGAARAREGRDRIIGPAVEPGRRISPPALIVSTLLTKGAPLPSPCSITFRASAMRELGGIPPEFTGHYEDQVLICKSLLACPALVLEECLARYRQHPGSLTEGNAPLERVRGSAAHAARRRFLGWLRGYVRARGLSLPELEGWIDAELVSLEGPESNQVHGIIALARALARSAAERCLPEPMAAAVAGASHRRRARRVRRRVMQRIDAVSGGGREARLERAIRAYWNERIHDTRLSDDPEGSAAFYVALDAYRLRKSDYLLRVVDFGGWTGRDVLEIGCGAGLDLVRFARGGAHVTGVDVARTAIDLARNYCLVAGVSASLLEADGALLPFPDGSFDLVYCMGVLSFAQDPAAIIAEAHRVLRPGGEAIFMVYNRRSWPYRIINAFGARAGRGHADAPGFRMYTREEFERMLAEFPRRRLQAERLPKALPDRWLRPYGWHLLAFCSKNS